MPMGGGVALAPITDADIRPVAAFLNAHLNSRVDIDSWAAALTPSWGVAAPNHGFLLRDSDTIVGVQLAIYSERFIDGDVVPFCNLAAWCVLEAHRSQGLRLLRSVLSQRGYTFTDFSPSGNVVAINQRLRFATLDTTTSLVPNLPWPTRPGRVHVTSDPKAMDGALTAAERRIRADHLGAAAARHVLVRCGGEHCYLILRRDRRKGLPVFGSVLYASHPALLRDCWPALSRHLLVRHRMLATLAETRVVGSRPPRSMSLRHSRPKMFRSDQVGHEHVDYLYSELTAVAW